MRTLKYAILGLIRRGPVTGYDIAREFRSQALSNFWHAKHSQIYPELKKLLEEGLITCEAVLQRGKKKKFYSLTPAGEEDFLQWVQLDEPPEPTPKDVFRLRIYYADAMEASRCRQLLESQREKHRERLQALEGMNQKFACHPAVSTPEHGDYLVLQGAILREKAYLDWLELCLREMAFTTSS